MRKPISIAMLISVGFHAALLLIVFPTPNQLPPATHEPPQVRLIEGPTADPRSPPAAEELPLPAAETAPAEPAESPAEGAAEPLPAAETLRLTDGRLGEAGLPDEQPPTVPAEAPADPEPSLVESVAIAADSLLPVATVTTTLPSPVRQAPLSQPERKMFDRKIRDWAETYHRKIGKDGELRWKHKGQEYVASFAELPADDEMALDRIVIDVSTEIDGERLSTSVSMKRLAFSSYAQFVNRWDKSVQLHDDELDGRFHSNSAINLAYSRRVKPRFHGKVTTSARRINVTETRGRLRRDQVFLGGLQTGVRSIRLPKDFVPLPAEFDLTQEQVQRFDVDTRITFHEDGSYSWIPLEGSLFERRGTLRDPASYLIAADKVRLEVKGTVDGKVLVYSPERIVIVGDLVYATDPETDASANDFIGLVSNKNIEIAGPKITGPGDLEITAAMYARRRFTVSRISAKTGGLLSIFGSLTAGSLSATEPRFATRIRFDPRLESRRPPGFPVTDRYELESWDAAWTVQEDERPPTSATNSLSL